VRLRRALNLQTGVYRVAAPGLISRKAGELVVPTVLQPEYLLTEGMLGHSSDAEHRVNHLDREEKCVCRLPASRKPALRAAAKNDVGQAHQHQAEHLADDNQHYGFHSVLLSLGTMLDKFGLLSSLGRESKSKSVCPTTLGGAQRSVGSGSTFNRGLGTLDLRGCGVYFCIQAPNRTAAPRPPVNDEHWRIEVT